MIAGAPVVLHLARLILLLVFAMTVELQYLPYHNPAFLRQQRARSA